jgi:ribose transport system permease protein
MSQEPSAASRTVSALRHGLSPSRIGAVYVLVLMVIVFAALKPDLFLQFQTVQQVINTNAILAMAALALVVPFAAGIFDVSVPYTMTLSGAVCSYGMVYSGWSITVAVLVAVVVGVIVGALNGLVVVTCRIDSFIGTLGTGFLIQALVVWRTDNRVITGGQLAGSFANLAQYSVAGVVLPVIYAVVIAIGLWYLLVRTPIGRRIYATGFNKEAARLASVRTNRLQFGALATSSVLGSLAGLVLVSSLGSGAPTAGNSYLLPAFAALFLGATQFQPGRFNPWGTLLAVVLLGTLTTGLGLIGASSWIQQFATGFVLLVALAVTRLERREIRRGKFLAPDSEDQSPGEARDKARQSLTQSTERVS